MNDFPDVHTRTVLLYCILGFYAAGIAFAAVLWLCWGHTELQGFVTSNFQLVAGAAAVSLGLVTGVQVHAAALERAARLRVQAPLPNPPHE